MSFSLMSKRNNKYKHPLASKINLMRRLNTINHQTQPKYITQSPNQN